MGLQIAKFLNFFNRTETVLKPLSEFNNGGNRILSKTVLPQKSSLFFKLGAPLGTSSAEKLVIEKMFGEQSVEIITFKNAKGKVIGRLRKNFNRGNLENSVESRYTILSKARNKYEKLDYNIADIQRQIFNADNELIKMKRLKLDTAVLDSAPKDVHITKMTYEAEKNNQGIFDGLFSISHKISGKTDKELCLDLSHSRDGVKLSQKVAKRLNISDDILSDPYLSARAMPDEFGIKSLLELLKSRLGLENKKTTLFYIKGNDINCNLGLVLDNRQIGIAVIPTLRETLDTIAHELRHFRQDEFASEFFKQLWYKITGSKNYNSHIYKLAKRFKKFNLCNNPFPVTANSTSIMKKWHFWGKEADAWHYAERYKSEFDRYSEKLVKEFPNISEYFLGSEDFINYLRFISPKS